MIPAHGVCFERRDHARQCLAQRVLRLPAKETTGASDVDRVVVVGNIDHPGSNEGILAEKIVLHPGPRFGEGFGDLACLPGLAMQQPSDLGLKIAVANDLRLAEKQRLGSMVNADEVAQQLGEVLNLEVKAFAVPRAAWAEAFEQFGIPKGRTGPAEDMFEAVNAGWMDLGAADT